ncbi:hypothetical protein JCM21714_2063 [Gracilibacillus boraciitolerans JCM 21714]|uniref:Uncharacterized protein n=1 Tax=Gracilibacillus boraciitolerans JCM 21714 TaxID=1298598 RepID=W4VJN6_9BACI|nr:hypothetical protein [Gracilibacillus boraciitolerans]GAE93033.1 hypothetical protein JCM21714_2063 [Gracilibacillus boraciitolerans JCM 21714]
MPLEFFNTVLGRNFYEGDVPKIAASLEKIASEIERGNDLKEVELNHKKRELNR